MRSSAPLRFFWTHPNVAAALLFALLVFAYLWPALVGGKLLSPTAILYGFSPWRPFAPPDIGSYANGLLSDVPTADYPWRFLIRELLHAGTFPSWNPFVLGGIPLYSNPQTGLFSLFSLPLWILPLNYGIGLGAALKLWAAGFGTYLLVRQLRIGFLPALLAGACFSFSAINIVWLTHETLPAVAALLPWMLWLVERIHQGGRLGSLLGLAAVTAIGLGGGHPGMQVHLLAAAGMYALLRAACLPRSVSMRERARPLGLALAGILLGTLLMSFMLLPEVLSSRGTLGTEARAGGRGTLPGTEMPLTTIRTVLFPDWWGRPSGFEEGAPLTQLGANVFVRVNYNERTFFAGTVGLLLALVGVAAGGQWRRKAPFAVLAALGLAIPLHFPGLYQLVTHLPAFELVQNQRLHFVWALGVAVLAAFGTQALLDRPRGDRRRLAVAAGALALGGLALAGVGPSGTTVSQTVEHFVSGTDFASPAVLKLTSVVWYLLFAAGVGLALLAVRLRPAWRTWIAGGLVVLAALDMLHFATGYQPMGPASKTIPPRTPAIAFLQERRDDGRILGVGGTLTNDWSLTYGLRDIRGYDPPQPSLRYFRLWKQAEPGQFDWTSFAMSAMSPQTLQVASVLGARYVVTDPGVEPPVGESDPTRALRVVYDDEDARVFENQRAVPRAMVASSVRVVGTEGEARGVLTNPAFDPLREVVMTGEDAAGLGSVTSGGSPPGTVAVTRESNDTVALEARLSRRALVVLNDSLTPGWTVRVDGRDAEEVLVNETMRGVVVDAGTHAIEWRYRVPGLRAGAGLSVLALLIAAFVAGRAKALTRGRSRRG